MFVNMLVTLAADNAPQSATATVANTPGPRTMAAWALMTPDPGNSQTLYWGGPTVTNTNGMPLDAGAKDMAPFPADEEAMVNLADLYFYGKAGDKVRIVYGR